MGCSTLVIVYTCSTLNPLLPKRRSVFTSDLNGQSSCHVIDSSKQFGLHERDFTQIKARVCVKRAGNKQEIKQ